MEQQGSIQTFTKEEELIRQQMFVYLKSVPTKARTQLQLRKKKFLADFIDETKALLPLELFMVPETLDYIMKKPVDNFPYLRKNLAERAQRFQKVSKLTGVEITEYAFVQPMVDRLDAANASVQCYTMTLWLFCLQKMILSVYPFAHDKAVIVASPDLIVAKVQELLRWIENLLRDMRAEGCIVTRMEPISLEKEKKIIVPGKGTTLAKETYIVQSRVLYMKKPYSKMANVRKEMLAKDLDIALLKNFDKNIRLQKDTDALAALHASVDNLLDALMPTAQVGHARKLRPGKIQRIANLISRAYGSDVAATSFETIAFQEDLVMDTSYPQDDAVMNQALRQPKKSTQQVVQPTPQIKGINDPETRALRSSRVAPQGTPEESIRQQMARMDWADETPPEPISLEDEISKINDRYVDGMEAEEATAALQGLFGNKILKQGKIIYLTNDGLLTMKNQAKLQGIYSVSPSVDQSTPGVITYSPKEADKATQ